MSDFIFETVPKIVCECGGVRRLGELALALGMTRALVVTDRGLIRAGVLGEALHALEAAGLQVTVYSEVLPDPPEANVQAAVDAALAARVDGVIGLGGGSSLDTAKLVALLARTPQSLASIYGVGLAQGRRWPLIQVPTTAGTGSEATPISILTTPTHEKKGIVSPLLLPDIALLDARLTLGLPPPITAMTGVDAMVHAIEAYTSRLKKNPPSDALALAALQLLYANLPHAVACGDDLPARENMLIGSHLAGVAFANAPVAAVHALAYPLGGHYGLPHGLANSLLLLPVMEFNRSHALRPYAELGRAILGASFRDDAAADALIAALRERIAAMPYAQRLRDAGVAAADLPELARDAMKVQRLLVNNPRELAYDDALAIYRAAY